MNADENKDFASVLSAFIGFHRQPKHCLASLGCAERVIPRTIPQLNIRQVHGHADPVERSPFPVGNV
jgi:hypothetical protein